MHGLVCLTILVSLPIQVGARRTQRLIPFAFELLIQQFAVAKDDYPIWSIIWTELSSFDYRFTVSHRVVLYDFARWA
jgi:hypothetical protein